MTSIAVLAGILSAAAHLNCPPVLQGGAIDLDKVKETVKQKLEEMLQAISPDTISEQRKPDWEPIFRTRYIGRQARLKFDDLKKSLIYRPDGDLYLVSFQDNPALDSSEKLEPRKVSELIAKKKSNSPKLKITISDTATGGIKELAKSLGEMKRLEVAQEILLDTEAQAPDAAQGRGWKSFYGIKRSLYEDASLMNRLNASYTNTDGIVRAGQTVKNIIEYMEMTPKYKDTESILRVYDSQEQKWQRIDDQRLNSLSPFDKSRWRHVSVGDDWLPADVKLIEYVDHHRRLSHLEEQSKQGEMEVMNERTEWAKKCPFTEDFEPMKSDEDGLFIMCRKMEEHEKIR